MTRRRENDTTIRKLEILDAAMRLSLRVGYNKISRSEVAKAAISSPSLVTWFFNNMEGLRKDIIKTAIKREILPLLAQAWALGNKQIKSIDPELKQKVIKYLTGD